MKFKKIIKPYGFSTKLANFRQSKGYTDKRKFDHFVDRVDKIFTLLKYVLIIAVICYPIWKIYKVSNDPVYYLGEVSVPKTLIESGFDEKEVKNLIRDNIANIISRSKFHDNRLLIDNELQEKFSLTYGGLDLGRIFSSWFAPKKLININVQYQGKSQLEVTYNMDGDLQGHILRLDGLEDYHALKLLLYTTSEDISRKISPVTIATYEFNQKNFRTCISDINSEADWLPDDQAYVQLMNLKGNCYIELKQYKQAIQAFKAGLNVDQRDYYLNSNLAYAYLYSNDCKQAKIQITEIKKLDLRDSTSQASFQNLQGNYFSWQRNFNSAKLYYAKAVDLAPQANDYLLNLGYNYASLLKYDTAESVLDSLNVIKPDAFLSDNYRSIGFWQTQDQIYDQIQKSISSSHPYKYGLFSNYLFAENNNSTEQNISALKNLLSKFPDFGLIYYKLGVQYNMQGDYPASIKYLLLADSIMPINPDVYKAEVNSYLSLGDDQRAESIANFLLINDNLNPLAVSLMAKVSNSIARIKEAEYYFQYATLLNPDNLDILRQYCEFKKDSGDQPGVISLCEQILDIAPGDPMATQDIAWANLELGNSEYATFVSKSLVKSDYNTAINYIILAKTAIRSGQARAAFNYYMKASSTNLYPEAAEFIANYYYNQKNYPATINWFRKLKTCGRLSAVAYLELGTCLEITGNQDEAIAAFHSSFLLNHNNAMTLKNWFISLRKKGVAPLNDDDFRTALDNSKCDISNWLKSAGVTYVK